uniref:Uncharacterized protein n=1 Tax=Candidatus Kentrum sp. TC TaxID=2126339 RepID=A0A450ZW87_9GAMM|nr:MAG: hypothetical protein BECKTC1821F_GA0114240_102128 [Candidatus Kentron sp. TC]
MKATVRRVKRTASATSDFIDAVGKARQSPAFRRFFENFTAKSGTPRSNTLDRTKAILQRGHDVRHEFIDFRIL